jgi:xanthine/CO dehydrogenase XdhC/CoxF family maturation factor
MIGKSIASAGACGFGACALGKNCLSKEGRNFMRDILPDVERWRERGERVAVATVVTMYGSAPRRPGAKLAVSESGELTGSVSGGCVEPAVVDSAMEVIETGEPQMLEFGISEEENFEKIGLSCGGTIHVFVERLDW